MSKPAQDEKKTLQDIKPALKKINLKSTGESPKENKDDALTLLSGRGQAPGAALSSDFVKSLVSMVDAKLELTSISISQYQSLFTDLMRDEIQIVLQASPQDMFSEELRAILQNIQVS